MLINNEFNKLQINETIEKDGNGNVYKRSLMFNIRSNSVEEAEKLYRQLKARLNGSVSHNGFKNGKVVDDSAPVCECGRQMVPRQGVNGAFYGCSGFPQCRRTKGPDGVEVIDEEVQVEETPMF
jgi:hypothetical protein